MPFARKIGPAKPLKKRKCVECGVLAQNTITGRCPKCNTIHFTLEAASWEFQAQLVRTIETPEAIVTGSVSHQKGMPTTPWQARLFIEPHDSASKRETIVSYHPTPDAAVANLNARLEKWLRTTVQKR